MRFAWRILAWSCALPSVAPAQPTVAFTNGHWFNGREFEPRVMYSVNGLFVTLRPATIDTTIDLQGGHVVPPFGEAHNTISKAHRGPTQRCRATSAKGSST